MADICDLAEATESLFTSCAVRQATAIAANIPKGEPGECKFCGEPSKRLVGKACAPCRDLRHLP